MGVVSRDFAEVGWRLGLGTRKPRSGVRNQRNEAGCRHRRKRGAGGRPRCVWWPRCALYGCVALRSAHLTSRQTVTRRTLRIRRGWIYFCPSRPLTRSISVMDLPVTRVVRVKSLKAEWLVGPVAALADQIAIDLHLRCVCRRKDQGETIGPFVLRGRESQYKS